MNQYMNSKEMQNFLRFCAISAELKNAIGLYSSKPNLDKDDKEFLKYLRSANTWADKAISFRMDRISDSTKGDLKIRLSHVQFDMVPNDRFWKIQKELKENGSMFHIMRKEMAKLYGVLGELACGKCKKRDWEKCGAREILQKYGLPAVDSYSKKCPYMCGSEDRKTAYKNLFNVEGDE